MIDFHCHILPGLDDGAATQAEALAMAQLLATAGFTHICCTSHHIRGVWDLPAARVHESVTALQYEIDRAGVSVQLVPGREYYFDEFLADLDDLILLPGGHLLVEFPDRGNPDHVRNTLYQLVRRKIVPLVAHPEQTPLLFSLPEPCRTGFMERIGGFLNTRNETPTSVPLDGSLLTYLREIGCGFQGNLGSFAGLYGSQIRRNAVALLQAGVYTHLGSNAHSSKNLAEKLTRGRDLVHSIVGDEAMHRLFGAFSLFQA